MAQSPRLIRRRIKSVTNTRKITKAMELVAASKMRKAIAATLASRPYSETAWAAIEAVAGRLDAAQHPLLGSGNPDGRTLVVLISTDRGLCGGINSRLQKALYDFTGTRDLDVAVVGRKGLQACARRGLKVVASWEGVNRQPVVSDVAALARLVTDDFTSGKYGSVHIAFTDFRSAMVQTPVVKQLLPLRRIEGLSEVGDTTAERASVVAPTAIEYAFEPSPAVVLNALLPRIVESQLYQAVLESLASEQSARMMAMRSASDAASEVIDVLTLNLNRARQAGITMEIAEISSGKAALDKAR